MISDNFVTGDNIYLRELQNFFFEVLGMMSITHYGAVGDGRVDNYGALQVAIDDAHRRGLSFLYVPYGKFIYTGELINLEGITFMGNPHAKIVNIRTSEEIPIYQFGWLGDAYYNREEADGKFVKKEGDTMSGSLAIGTDCEAGGSLSFAQGAGCTASNLYAHAINQLTTASGRASHAEGYNTEASGTAAHAEGDKNTASGTQSHAEGYSNTSSGPRAHAEGGYNTAGGRSAHAEGQYTIASADTAHAEGEITLASGEASHAEGKGSQATSAYAHAEGQASTASGEESHAEGLSTIASGYAAHAEGRETIASRGRAHAEGYKTVASGWDAHAENYMSKATGDQSHAQGHVTTASGNFSFSGGHTSVASGQTSTSLGYLTTATRASQFVIGRGNVVESGSGTSIDSTSGAFIVGNGTINNSTLEVTNPSNALKLTNAGDLYIAGTLTQNGADYAECIEWEDGNPLGEDRTGRIAVIENGKMRLATSTDDKSLMGVISAKPTVLGNAYEEYWHGKYVTDVYGRIQYDTVDDEQVPRISEEFDPTQEYIPRTQRPEYGNFAMLGKLIVEDDGTCVVGSTCFPGANGIATNYYEGFYVMERIDANHIKIFVR